MDTNAGVGDPEQGQTGDNANDTNDAAAGCDNEVR